jgi:signal transduction histidine kinase
VLLVEDNDEMRRFIADVLVDEFSVVAASDGEQALVNADVLRPDLIISDLMMPRLDGEQLIAEIRSRRELEATPVLLLSARSDETTRVRLLQTGADDYVIKPFVPAELRARTRNLVRIKRAADILRSALNGASHDIETLAQRLALRGRQLQAALDGAEVARKQAERANLVKSQFLALISHEMRTPLSTVMLNLQLLTMDRSSPLPATAGTRVTRATVAARQLQSTIDGLLKYVQVESGRLETRFDYVDVPALAAETVEEFRIHTEGKPVELSVDLPPEPVPPTRTDPRLLKVILGNLLSNAIKYTQRGTIRVSTTVGPDSLALVVQDTGIGIAPADLDRVFEPFEQIEPLTRKSIPGVGIGLTLVRELAAQLGGRVELASQPQVGTTFRVILPLTALEPAERSPLNEDKV